MENSKTQYQTPTNHISNLKNNSFISMQVESLNGFQQTDPLSLTETSFTNTMMDYTFFPSVLIFTFAAFYIALIYLRRKSSLMKLFSCYKDCMITFIALQFTFTFFSGVIISELHPMMIFIFTTLVIMDQIIFVKCTFKSPKNLEWTEFMCFFAHATAGIFFIAVTGFYLPYDIPHWIFVGLSLLCITSKGLTIAILSAKYSEDVAEVRGSDGYELSQITGGGPEDIHLLNKV